MRLVFPTLEYKEKAIGFIEEFGDTEAKYLGRIFKDIS